MRRSSRVFILLLYAFLTTAAFGQNTVTVTASKIHDGTPTGLLSAGTILFQAVNAQDQNISYQVGGTGPSITSPTICSITNGAITGTCTLPNVSVANPQNFFFAVTVKNTANVVVLGGPGTAYNNLQPVPNSSWCTAGVCNFDLFFPTIPNAVYTLFLPPPKPNSLGGIYSESCGSGKAVIGYDIYGHEICAAFAGGGGTWGTITGTLANQTDLYTYLLTLAPLNSPSFTGVPSVPTPLLTDNSTTIPNTSWINSKGFAPLLSPNFTGVPTAPTPLTADSSTKIATTAWVNAQGYSSGTGNVTGPGSSTLNDVVLFGGTNGQTIIDAGFGFPLAPAHIGTLVAGSNGLANSATTDTTNAGNIGTGILPAARLPNPSSTTFGGVKSYAAVSHQWLNSLATTGLFTSTQPACGDLSNVAASCSVDATNASNITTGTLAAARMGAGYPLNFVGNPTANWGSSGSPITFGTNRAFLQIGDYGASPVSSAIYLTDNASSTTDITPNILFDTGASPLSRHSSLAASLQGVPQFIICWEPGPQGKTMIASVFSCSQETTSPFAKLTVVTSAATGSATHTVARLYTQSTAYTGTMLEMNSATVPGSGWNFFKACASATAGNGGCAGGTVVAGLDGNGLFTSGGLVLNGATWDVSDYSLRSGGTAACNGAPTAGHLKTCYGSDNRWQLSNNGLAFSDLMVASDLGPFPSCDPTTGSFLTWDTTGSNPANLNNPNPGWYCSGNGPYFQLSPTVGQQNLISPVGATVSIFTATMPSGSTANLFTINCQALSNCVYADASGNLHAVSFQTTGQSSTQCLSLPGSAPPAGYLFIGCDSATKRWYAMNDSGTVTELGKGQCEIVWGGTGTANVLQGGDDSIVNNSCFNKTGASRTISAVYCMTDVASNTVTINPTLGASGTGTTILSGALTCGSSNAYSATGTVANAALADGSGINPVQGGTLNAHSVHVLVVF